MSWTPGRDSNFPNQGSLSSLLIAGESPSKSVQTFIEESPRHQNKASTCYGESKVSVSAQNDILDELCSGFGNINLESSVGEETAFDKSDVEYNISKMTGKSPVLNIQDDFRNSEDVSIGDDAAVRFTMDHHAPVSAEGSPTMSLPVLITPCTFPGNEGECLLIPIRRMSGQCEKVDIETSNIDKRNSLETVSEVFNSDKTMKIPEQLPTSLKCNTSTEYNTGTIKSKENVSTQLETVLNETSTDDINENEVDEKYISTLANITCHQEFETVPAAKSVLNSTFIESVLPNGTEEVSLSTLEKEISCSNGLNIMLSHVNMTTVANANNANGIIAHSEIVEKVHNDTLIECCTPERTENPQIQSENLSEDNVPSTVISVNFVAEVNEIQENVVQSESSSRMVLNETFPDEAPIEVDGNILYTTVTVETELNTCLQETLTSEETESVTRITSENLIPQDSEFSKLTSENLIADAKINKSQENVVQNEITGEIIINDTITGDVETELNTSSIECSIPGEVNIDAVLNTSFIEYVGLEDMENKQIITSEKLMPQNRVLDISSETMEAVIETNELKENFAQKETLLQRDFNETFTGEPIIEFDEMEGNVSFTKTPVEKELSSSFMAHSSEEEGKVRVIMSEKLTSQKSESSELQNNVTQKEIAFDSTLNHTFVGNGSAVIAVDEMEDHVSHTKETADPGLNTFTEDSFPKGAENVKVILDKSQTQDSEVGISQSNNMKTIAKISELLENITQKETSLETVLNETFTENTAMEVEKVERNISYTKTATETELNTIFTEYSSAEDAKKEQWENLAFQDRKLKVATSENVVSVAVISELKRNVTQNETAHESVLNVTFTEECAEDMVETDINDTGDIMYHDNELNATFCVTETVQNSIISDVPPNVVEGMHLNNPDYVTSPCPDIFTCVSIPSFTNTSENRGNVSFTGSTMQRILNTTLECPTPVRTGKVNMSMSEDLPPPNTELSMSSSENMMGAEISELQENVTHNRNSLETVLSVTFIGGDMEDKEENNSRTRTIEGTVLNVTFTEHCTPERNDKAQIISSEDLSHQDCEVDGFLSDKATVTESDQKSVEKVSQKETIQNQIANDGFSKDAFLSGKQEMHLNVPLSMSTEGREHKENFSVVGNVLKNDESQDSVQKESAVKTNQDSVFTGVHETSLNRTFLAINTDECVKEAHLNAAINEVPLASANTGSCMDVLLSHVSETDILTTPMETCSVSVNATLEAKSMGMLEWDLIDKNAENSNAASSLLPHSDTPVKKDIGHMKLQNVSACITDCGIIENINKQQKHALIEHTIEVPSNAPVSSNCSQENVSDLSGKVDCVKSSIEKSCKHPGSLAEKVDVSYINVEGKEESGFPGIQKNEISEKCTPVQPANGLVVMNEPGSFVWDNKTENLVNQKHGTEFFPNNDGNNQTQDLNFVLSDEVFKDPSTFDFLTQFGNSHSLCDLRKESLYIKFDPLLGGSPRSVTVFDKHVPMSNTVREEERNVEINLTMKAAREGLGTMRKSPQEDMVEVVEKFLKPKSPLLNSNESKNISIVHKPDNYQEELDSLKAQITELQETSRKENDAHKSEVTKYTSQIISLDFDLVSQGETIAKLKKDLEKNRAEKKGLHAVMVEYENAVSQLVAEKEQSSITFRQMEARLTKELQESHQKLIDMENVYSEVQKKCENFKSTVKKFTENEENLVSKMSSYEKAVEIEKQKYVTLKAHAASQLESANERLSAEHKRHKLDCAKLNSTIAKLELRVKSLQEELEQKTKENKQLMTMCNELVEQFER